MDCVTLYQDANFEGKSQTFGVGKHDMNALDEIGNDSLSSLEVRPGYKVTLFEDAGFEGKSAVFGPGDHDMDALTGCGFGNDGLSSMIVEQDGGKIRLCNWNLGAVHNPALMF